MKQKISGNTTSNSQIIAFFWYCLLLLSPILIHAQDRIIRTDSSIIEARIVEIGKYEITYKKISDLDGFNQYINKSDVLMIIYQNGEKVAFNQYSKPNEASQENEKKPADNYSSPVNLSENPDVIIRITGDSIRCCIDNVSKTDISYHISRPGRNPRSILALTETMKYYFHKQWSYSNGIDPSVEKARNFILNGKINDAIGFYSTLVVQDSTNAALLAEDAFALALGGLYEAALYRLDRSWTLGMNTPDVNYYTACVFELMGYSDLTSEFWKINSKYKSPEWITLKSAGLIQKFAKKSTNQTKPDRLKIKADFKRASLLDSLGQNFQAIGIYLKVISIYPKQYLPYIGYSMVLEKMGALVNCSKAIEKAIALIGENPDDQDMKQYLVKRLEGIKNKLGKNPSDEMPGLTHVSFSSKSIPIATIYFGGSFASSYINFAVRYGYFVEESSSLGMDFGITRIGKSMSANLGLNAYIYQKIFVSGVGLSLMAAGGKITSNFRISIGISKKNAKKTSSFDAFFDISSSIAKKPYMTYSFTVGKSFYFGRRK